MKLSPLQQHKADLETIIFACRMVGQVSKAPVSAHHAYARIAQLAEAMLLRIPEESHCPNHPADQICPDCTA